MALAKNISLICQFFNLIINNSMYYLLFVKYSKQEPSGHPISASNVVWIIVNYSSTRVSWPLLAFYDWGGADSPLPIFRKQCHC